MAIPQVTCSADVVLSYSASPRTQALGASATGGPTAWKWEMLSVPPGSAANVGIKGDFIDGVSTIQNPSMVLDGAVDGGYCLQCTAQNGDGWSSPAIDKQSGQQLVIVRTSVGQLWLPPDYGYDWGEKYLNPTLRKVEADIAAGDPDALHKSVSAEISAITEKTAPLDADLLVIEDSEDSNAKKRLQIGSLPGRLRPVGPITDSTYVADYWDYVDMKGNA